LLGSPGLDVLVELLVYGVNELFKAVYEAVTKVSRERALQVLGDQLVLDLLHALNDRLKPLANQLFD